MKVFDAKKASHVASTSKLLNTFIAYIFVISQDIDFV